MEAESWLKAAVGSRVGEFYAEIGVELPGSGDNASVRCFANASAHNHEDKSKSCSVSLISGLWKCHGCGRGGNAYDAAIALGVAPRHAADLAKKHGLFLERARQEKKPRLPTETQIRKWRESLMAGQPRVLRRLREVKGWTPEAIARCGLGWDGERVVFPIRARMGNTLKLVGVARYLPGGKPKMIAAPGSKRDLFPPPELATRQFPLFVVEGEPDAVSVRSVGHQAVAIPGVASWRDEWWRRFGGHRVIVMLDCDAQGRGLARTVQQVVPNARLVDLDPARDDGYDIGDFVAEASRDGGPAQVHRFLKGLV